jgi:hypothetical protein
MPYSKIMLFCQKYLIDNIICLKQMIAELVRFFLPWLTIAIELQSVAHNINNSKIFYNIF